MKNNYLFVFSGYNQRAVMAFLRTLEECGMDCYGIIASSNEDAVFQTAYASKVIYTRKDMKLSVELFQEIIQNVGQKVEDTEFVIAPSTEGLNRFLLEERDALQRIHCRIPLVGEKLYCTISDKEPFARLCRAAGMNIPPMMKKVKCFTEPFVAKPKKYCSEKSGQTFSPVLVTNVSEYDEFCVRYDPEDFFFQKYITGDSYYLLYYITREGELFKFSQMNLAQQPEGKSILAAIPASIHEESISHMYEKQLLDLDYSGFIMIELRKNKGKYYMIEANPRFWGPSQLFCDAGVNLFTVFLWEYGFISREKVKTEFLNRKSRYFWKDGIRQTLDDGKKIVIYGEELKDNWYEDSEWKKWDVFGQERLGKKGSIK